MRHKRGTLPTRIRASRTRRPIIALTLIVCVIASASSANRWRWGLRLGGQTPLCGDLSSNA
jgi:hypothetical protein